jgi:c-di-GMP-binding flagellar brake protein YcgR
MAVEEKRKYPRLSLDIEDGYFGNFKLANDDTIVAPILNLSGGGLNMAASQGDLGKIKEGDILMLKNIVGGTNLSFLGQIKSQIRWVKQLKPGYLSVGCRFEGIEPAVRQQVMKFVDSERVARGQYD